MLANSPFYSFPSMARMYLLKSSKKVEFHNLLNILAFCILYYTRCARESIRMENGHEIFLKKSVSPSYVMHTFPCSISRKVQTFSTEIVINRQSCIYNISKHYFLTSPTEL